MTPPNNATLIEKIWSMVTPAVNAGWTSASFQCDLLYVHRTCHADRKQHLVEQVESADEQEGSLCGK